MRRLCNKRTKGFSLAEAMIAIVVLGIAASGMLLPYTSGATAQAEGVNRTLAAKLARNLMEEIVSRPFNQIIPMYGSRTEPQGYIMDAGGVVLPGTQYANFSRNSQCVYIYVPQESGTAPPKLILAKIQVFYKGRPVAVINRLISR